jgi:hypothetical protein
MDEYFSSMAAEPADANTKINIAAQIIDMLLTNKGIIEYSPSSGQAIFLYPGRA